MNTKNLLLSIFATLFLFSANALAGMSLHKGSPITIELYNSNHKMFLVKLNEAPEHGPYWANPQNLQNALKMDGTLKDFMKNPNQWAGSVFTLQADLPLEKVPMADFLPSEGGASTKKKKSKGR